MSARGRYWATLLVLASSGLTSAQESDSSWAEGYRVPGAPRVPAAEPLLSLEPLVADLPHRFLYDLGSTGFPHGIGSYGLLPTQQSLTLEGVPFDDLFTGRPRFDLLPLELLGVAGAEPAFGYVAGTSAVLRPLPAPVARTELRYVTGQEGTQQIGATHAQDRRPGFVGEDGRLGGLAHVSGRDAGGFYRSSDTGGFRALGRVRLLRPTYTVEVVELQQRQNDEARSDVRSFDPSVEVDGAGTSRETVRNDLWATAERSELGPGDLTGQVFWTVQRSSYRTADTTFDQRSARGSRLGARLSYSVPIGSYRLEAFTTGWRSGRAQGDALADASAYTFLTAGLRSTSRWGPLTVRAEGAAQVLDGETRPSLALSAIWPEVGLTASIRSGSALPVRSARAGGFGITSYGAPRAESTLAEAAWHRSIGAFDVRVSPYLLYQRRLVVPAFDPAGAGVLDSVAVVGNGSSLLRAGGEARAGWRLRAARGLYGSVRVSGQVGQAESGLGDRLLHSLPDYWAHGEVGWRAVGAFGGVLDLDASLFGRAWPAFQGLDFYAPSATFALPALAVPSVPSGATLGARLSARVQQRASVFVLYENALGARATDGPYLVPVFPLTPHQLSFGVFWMLLN